MSRRRRILGLFVAIAAVAMLVPAGALAGGGSAGDQQYVDPLGGSNSSGSGHHSGSGSGSGTTSTQPAAPSSTSSSSSTAPTASSSSGSSTTSASSTATATTASSTNQAADPSTSSTLPRTGLDIGLAVTIGVGLLGCGLALRRVRPD